MPGDLIACGEVGLGGELRQVAQTPRRLAEAARLGFRRAIVPASAPDAAGDLELVRVTSVAEAVRAAGLSERAADYSTMRATGPRPAGRGMEAISVS